MKSLFSYLLQQYDPQDQELRLKAGFVLAITLVVLSFLIVVLIYTSYLSGFFSLAGRIASLGFAFILLALIVLIRGRYALAVHMILSAGFTTPWAIMFFGTPQALIIRMDTIVYIIGIMATMPLLFFRTPKPMVFYFIANLLVFGLFLRYLHLNEALSPVTFLDYTLDNLVVMCFVFTAGFTLFAINKNVLSTLKKELIERRKAEENLDQLQILLSSTINSMPSIVIAVNKKFNIILWNNEARRYTGTKAETADKNCIFDFLPQLGVYRDTMTQVMEKKVVSQTFKICPEFNPESVMFDMTIYPIMHTDASGAVIRMDDCTQRVRMEEIMVQSEKMLSIGGLAAGMAHEINNPLGGMIQSTQVIKNRLTQEIPANKTLAKEMGLSLEDMKHFMEKREIFKLLDHIHAAGIRAAKIVDNMLGFARQSDNSPKEAEHMSDLVQEAVDLAESDFDLKKNYDFKRIQITKFFESDLPPVYCERAKIQQVILNILKNASEALASDPENLKPRIGLILTKSGNEVCLKIQDNGPGMDEATRKRVFEPFFTTKAVDKGTGLGMSVSYFIITEDHQGKMSLDTAPGQGACFKICLPAE